MFLASDLGGYAAVASIWICSAYIQRQPLSHGLHRASSSYTGEPLKTWFPDSTRQGSHDLPRISSSFLFSAGRHGICPCVRRSLETIRVSCCGTKNFHAALRRTLEILTAATRSPRCIRHRRRSDRSPAESGNKSDNNSLGDSGKSPNTRERRKST